MSNTKLRLVLGPERRKVDIKADLATSVHLERLSIELGQFEVHRSDRVSRWDLKAEIELPLDEVVHNPAFASPYSTISVRRNREPVVVFLFVLANVLDQHLVLFLEPVDPISIARPSHCTNEG